VKPFVRPLALAVIGALCAWALVRWVYTPYRCQREIAALGNSTKLADETAVDSRAAPLAQQNLRRARELEKPCRTCLTLYPIIAANEQILGRDDDAIATWRRAMAIAQRPEMHLAIGIIHMRRGHMDEAMNEFVIGGRFNPRIVGSLELHHLECQLDARLAMDRVSAR
jgi:hypothetical protein